MPNYLVNKNAQSNGDHEVHVTPQSLLSTCKNYPAEVNEVHLGYYATCEGAVQEAKRRGYTKANGCYFCANACHTR